MKQGFGQSPLFGAYCCVLSAMLGFSVCGPPSSHQNNVEHRAHTLYMLQLSVSPLLPSLQLNRKVALPKIELCILKENLTLPVVNVQKIKQCHENRRKLGQCKQCRRASYTQRINARLVDACKVAGTALYVICRNCRQLSSYLSIIECETVDVTTACLMKYEFLVVQGANWLSFLFENTFIRVCIRKNQI